LNNFQHILAIIQPGTNDLNSLKKSIVLAKNNHAHLTVLSLKPKNNTYFSNSNLSNVSNIAHDDKVISLVDFAKNEGIETDYDVCQDSNQWAAIEEYNEGSDYDLIVAEHLPDKARLWPFEVQDYRHLLNAIHEQSVLFVSKHKWHPQGHIIAAIETDELTDSHLLLNTDILNKTSDLAKLLSSDIHLLNCYLENCTVSFNANDDVKSKYDDHLAKLSDLAKTFHLKNDRLHVEEGLVDDVIPEQAKKLKANVVVMGCNEHRGILSQIKGHTIDQVFGKLSCDLLALQPHHCH